jgi:hypothetical protein
MAVYTHDRELVMIVEFRHVTRKPINTNFPAGQQQDRQTSSIKGELTKLLTLEAVTELLHAEGQYIQTLNRLMRS